jgi:hypothetical protein
MFQNKMVSEVPNCIINKMGTLFKPKVYIGTYSYG